MKRLIPIAMMAACISTAAFAEDGFSTPADNGAPTVGVGVICDTADQVERLVALRSDGTPADRAILVVNREASNPRACGLAATAFVPGKALANHAVEGGTIRVLEITIIGIATEHGWQRIPEQTQYTAVFVKSQEV